MDDVNVASFSHVKALYEVEKDIILKTTLLMCASIFPSHLQLQNVKHVLNVFNERVVAAHCLRRDVETEFIQQILD